MDLSGLRKTLPEVEEPPKKVCAMCQAPADKSCGACHNIDYCSAEHQKSHWKVHKKDCSPIRIASSPDLGPHYIATRDLSPGTIIHTEPPVLVNPFFVHEDFPGHIAVACISCLSILPSPPWPCFQCSTPFFCNLACSMNKIHTEFECGVLSKCNEEQKNELCIPPNLGYLRAMGLKNKDPQTWAKVLKFRGADQYKIRDADENGKWVIREILPLLGEKYRGYEADMAKLKGILQQKGMVDYLSDSSQKEYGEGQFLYLEGSNFTQNCFPNCTRIICKGPQFHLIVRTNVGIKKGSIISIDYHGVSNEFGSMTQKHKMNLIGGALCICPRCSDPTELGLMLSAFKCMKPNCNDGYLLPVDPWDMAQNASWRCIRSNECKGKGSTWREIDEIIKGLESDMEVFLASFHLEDLERTKKFLVSLKKKLHSNNWLIYNFLKRLIGSKVHSEMRKGMLGTELSIPGIQLYISMIEDMLKIVELTTPGLSLLKSHLWQNIVGILMAKWTRLVLSGRLYPEGWENEFKGKANEAIDQFCSIAKFYPELWTKELIEQNKQMKLSL